MHKYLLFFYTVISLFFNSCTNGQNLSAIEFSEKINALPSATIIDVRTPEEFAEGHLQNAKNYNWNGADFEKQTKTLDKSKPVFVYCLSGGRSSSAANKMRSDGFKKVFELRGGISKWRAENLPLTTKRF